MSDATEAALTKWLSKVEFGSGCWEWQGTRNPGGYGVIHIHGKTLLAHRLAMVLAGRPIPAGLQADHLCRNRACVRPSHLEPVTNRENSLRSPHRIKSHCVHGHALVGGNLIINSQGRRVCRTCKSAANRRYYLRKRAEVTGTTGV